MKKWRSWAKKLLGQSCKWRKILKKEKKWQIHILVLSFGTEAETETIQYTSIQQIIYKIQTPNVTVYKILIKNHTDFSNETC